MIHNLVHNLCESLVTNIGNIADTGKKTPPQPITYLTQWKIVGNSEVHTDPYLTSWKVEGNSVIDNNAILSCGDLGQDGKYHVKISDGVNIYDIALDEPLRKVNDVADSIEFANGVTTVTRELGIIADLSQLTWTAQSTRGSEKRWLSNAQAQLAACANDTYADILCGKYQTKQANGIYERERGITINVNKVIQIYDPNYILSEDKTAFVASLDGVELIAKLATPTTELVDAPQIAVSPTDTYTSANDTPYSAFEHTEHKEIWSCGEYNPTDGKYHILVQPQGGSIADIALDEPLRKVNDVADSIEFPSGTEGKALVTRNIISHFIGDCEILTQSTNTSGVCRWVIATDAKKIPSSTSVIHNILNTKFNVVAAGQTYNCIDGVSIDSVGTVIIYTSEFTNTKDANTFKEANADVEVMYEAEVLTTELVDAPQIAEAESYSCEISQGAKAVEWSSFETN